MQLLSRLRAAAFIISNDIQSGISLRRREALGKRAIRSFRAQL